MRPAPQCIRSRHSFVFPLTRRAKDEVAKRSGDDPFAGIGRRKGALMRRCRGGDGGGDNGGANKKGE